MYVQYIHTEGMFLWVRLLGVEDSWPVVQKAMQENVRSFVLSDLECSSLIHSTELLAEAEAKNDAYILLCLWAAHSFRRWPQCPATCSQSRRATRRRPRRTCACASRWSAPRRRAAGSPHSRASFASSRPTVIEPALAIDKHSCINTQKTKGVSTV